MPYKPGLYLGNLFGNDKTLCQIAPTKGFTYIHSESDPSGIRTRVTAVRGRRTRPLYDGALCSCYCIFLGVKLTSHNNALVAEGVYILAECLSDTEIRTLGY